MASYYADDVIEVWQTNFYGFHRTIRAVLPYTDLDPKPANIGCEFGSEIPGSRSSWELTPPQQGSPSSTLTSGIFDNCILANNVFTMVQVLNRLPIPTRQNDPH